MARLLGHCRIALVPRFDDPLRASQWSETGQIVDICVATLSAQEHDVALELLLCLGQVLWERLSSTEREAYWRLIKAEIDGGVTGEIDEDALAAKRVLMANHAHAGSPRYLEQYGRASFAAAAAEYVHCLWHDVNIRTGPEYLPALHLRRRLRLLERWFPPNPGYRLFPHDG